jgi:hypothetical protein
MQYEFLEHLLWTMNFFILVEAFFQLRPLFAGKPYGSRNASLVAAIKYGATMLINICMLNWPMSMWLLIGLIKEVISYLKLKTLKEGFTI